MRLDHIAYRTRDRRKTSEFFEKAFGYIISTEFQIEFDDASKADCLVLVPPENRPRKTFKWIMPQLQYEPSILNSDVEDRNSAVKMEYHAPPEIFVSDGGEGSIVADWGEERGGVDQPHHAQSVALRAARRGKRRPSSSERKRGRSRRPRG